MPSAVHLYIQITFLIFIMNRVKIRIPHPLSIINHMIRARTKTIESSNITAQIILIYKNIIEILKLTRSQAGYGRPKRTLHVCMFE